MRGFSRIGSRLPSVSFADSPPQGGQNYQTQYFGMFSKLKPSAAS